MLKHIFNLAIITFKGGVRTRVFITLIILSVVAFLVLIPSASFFSMRQVREVATSLCLSLISFILLVSTVFLGVSIIYRDIDSRIAYFVLSQPISRGSYIIGKFVGLVFIIVLSGILLTSFSSITLLISDSFYEGDLPIKWDNYLISASLELFKTFIVAAFAIFFSSFATNLFLPLFGTIGIYIIGSVTQSIYDYINTPYGEELPYITVLISKLTYYVFPNFTAFDIKFKAIYNLPIEGKYVLSVLAYELLYIVIILSLSVLIFRKREML
jgi:ABC-type transport system involved in multi-copper enzyme maturation permease subunit